MLVEVVECFDLDPNPFADGDDPFTPAHACILDPDKVKRDKRYTGYDGDEAEVHNPLHTLLIVLLMM